MAHRGDATSGGRGKGKNPHYSKAHALRRLGQLRAIFSSADPDNAPEAMNELLVNEDRTLGPWTRWFAVLLEVIEHAGGALGKSVPLYLSKAVSWPAAGRAGGRRDRVTLTAAFSDHAIEPVTVSVYRAGSEPLFEQLLGCLNKQRKHCGLHLLSVDALMRAPTDTVDDDMAFDRFRWWLRAGSQPAPSSMPVDLQQAMQPLAPAQSAVVEGLAEKFCAPFRAQVPVASQIQYANVHGRSSPTFRKTIAGHVVVAIEEALGKVEASRLPEQGARRLGIVYIDVTPRPGSAQVHRPADVLEALCRQFQLGVSTNLHDSVADFVEAMRHVRRALTLHPTMVVLDGISHVSGIQSGLIQVMSDRDWESFVRMLCQPDLTTALGNPATTRSGSALLVFSDEPLQQSHSWAVFVREASEKAAAPDIATLATHFSAPDAKALTLLMLSASVDGLRRATLQRCLRRWCALAHQVDILRPLADGLRTSDADALCNALLSDSSGLLVEVMAKVTIPGLHPRHRRYELEIDAQSRLEPGTEDDEWPPTGFTSDGGEKNSEFGRNRGLIAFVSESDRRLLLLRFLDMESSVASQRHVRQLMWWTTNWVLGEESISQATGALRHTSTGTASTIRGYRRLLQALFHGLNCGELDLSVERLSGASVQVAQSPNLIPKQLLHRHRFLYVYLYRYAIEGNDWILTRSMARSDVRVGLLSMFVVDDPRKLLRADADGKPDAFRAAIEAGWAKLLSAPQRIERQLLEDVMLNLAVAAVDADNLRIARCCVDQLEVLPDLLQQRMAPLAASWPSASLDQIEPNWPQRQATRTRALIKLELDLLDAQDQAAEAVRRCEEALNEFSGRAAGRQHYRRLAKKFSADFVRGTFELGTLQRALGEFVDGQFPVANERSFNWGRLAHLVDILARLADYEATEADSVREKVEDATAGTKAVEPRHWLSEQVEGFLCSWCIFFVADSIRDRLSTSRTDAMVWSPVSARPFRVYVRTSLKLARLAVDCGRIGMNAATTARPTRRPDLANRAATAREFIAHAQHCANIYVCTLNHHNRERIQGVVLQASIVRAWAHFVEGGARGGDATAEVAEAKWEVLKDAEHHMHRAESLLFELGAPDNLVRRILLERLSILIGQFAVRTGGSGSFHGADAGALQRIIGNYMGVLERMTRELPFWRRLFNRQSRRWRRAQASYWSAAAERARQSQIEGFVRRSPCIVDRPGKTAAPR